MKTCACVLGAPFTPIVLKQFMGTWRKRRKKGRTNLEAIIGYHGRKKRRKGIHIITTDWGSFFIINTNNWHRAVGLNIFIYIIYIKVILVYSSYISYSS